MEIAELYNRLNERYDVDGWWPAGSAWEAMVGAILVQQTTWESVEKVLDELKRRGLMDVDAIASVPLEELESIVRPAGFYRQKAFRIQHLARYLRLEHGSDPGGILHKDTGRARGELLSLPGIGDETADAILLFAGRRPKFISAAYVRRLLGRLGIMTSDDYEEVQRFMECHMPPDAELYARLYALMVHHSRIVCRSRPRCGGCCLEAVCRLKA